MADIYMRIMLSALGAGGVTSAISGISSSLKDGLGGALTTVAVAAVGAAVGLGVASVNAASAFQTAMDQNVAHAGLAKDQVNNVTQALLRMGPAVGQSPTVLATALYPVLSSLSGITDQGAKTSLALDEVKLAAESVAGSTTSVTDVTNAASAAFNAYGLQTNNAAKNTASMNNLFDVMNSTVSAGNMQWSSYSGVIGKLSVASHAAGVSFNETNAALADLTNQGYSARLAGTYLSNTYTTLYTKADTVAKNAQALGLSFDETKYKTMDLGDRIKYLTQITGGNQTELLKLMNGNSTALKTFDALSNSIGNYQSNLDALNHSQGATAAAFAVASSSFAFSMQRVQAAGQALLITIGSRLLPILTHLMSAVAPLIAQFSAWIETLHANSPVVAVFAGVLAGLVIIILVSAIPAFFSMAAGVIAATWPLLLIAIAVGALVTALILLYNRVPAVKAVINDFGKGVQSVFQSLQVQVGQSTQVMAQDTQRNTLQMKSDADTNTIAMAQKSIGNVQTMRKNLDTELGAAVTATQRHMLEMKLAALNHTQQEQEGVIKNTTKMRQGIEAQLAQLGPAAQLHTLTMQKDVLENTQKTAQKAIENLQGMKNGLEQQMEQTHSVVARHALAMRIETINHTIKMKEGMIENTQKAKDGIEKNMSAIQKVVDSDNNNVVLRAVGVWKSFQQGVSVAGAFIWQIIQKIGQFLTTTFAPAWKQVAQVYQSQLLPALNQFTTTMRPILPQLETFGKVIVGIVVVALVLLVSVLAGVVTGLAYMLPGVVRTFTGVVQVISGAVEVISGIIAFFVDLLTGNFTKLGADLGVIWAGIVTMFKGGWSIIVGLFLEAAGLIGGIVIGFCSTVKNIFVGLYDDLVGHSIIPDMINGIAAWVGRLPSLAIAGIQSFISMAIGQLSNFVGTAENLGANIVNGIANGIRSAASNATGAISSVMSAIGNFLPHSPAREGELSHLNEYGPSLVKGFSTGIVQSIPVAQNAMSRLTGPIASSLSASGASASSSGGGASPGTTIINVTVNGVIGNKNDVVTWIERDLSQRVNRSGTLSTTRSGGRASS